MGAPAAILTTTSTAPTPVLRAVHVGQIEEAAKHSHSASTRRNYRACWKRFATWCEEEGHQHLPAAPRDCGRIPHRPRGLRVEHERHPHGRLRDPAPPRQHRDGQPDHVRRRQAGAQGVGETGGEGWTVPTASRANHRGRAGGNQGNGTSPALRSHRAHRIAGASCPAWPD